MKRQPAKTDKPNPTFVRRIRRWAEDCRIPARTLAIASATLIVFGAGYDIYRDWNFSSGYELGPRAESLLLPRRAELGAYLRVDRHSGIIGYNQNHAQTALRYGQSSEPKFQAAFALDPAEGTTVTDMVNATSITIKPRFRLNQPVQDDNRLVYPLAGTDGAKVITLASVGFKEDIILYESPGDTARYDYQLELPPGVEARLEPDGSLGFYGADTALLGEISTANESDAKLLENARQNAQKDKLLFRSPPPYVAEQNRRPSSAAAWYTLEDDVLSLHASGLGEARYPLSIDPSITVTSAVQFMRGNPESNVGFDIDNELIKKGDLTGGSIQPWSSTLTLNQSIWNAATAAAGGYIYSVGGNDGSDAIAGVYWTELNTANRTMMSPNPGAGACSGWCTDSDYDLPEAREALSLVAYNGYLYAMGGIDASGDRSDHVYIAKLGANGEPRLWHPTDADTNNWVYWYRDTSTDLSSERSYLVAAAHMNRLYVLGGQTDAEAGGVTSVEYADINPDGTFSAWSTTGMSGLPTGAGRHRHSVEVYNDRLYVIGGVEGTVTTGNIVDSVFYAKLTNGAMSSWENTSSLTSARMAQGGGFTAVLGGYLYQAGGCSAVDINGYCTAIEETSQFASINADGSLTSFKDVSGADAQFMGHGLEAWNGALYRIGGCTAQNDTNGECDTVVDGVSYASVNLAGDISDLSVSASSGNGTCTGSDPYDCHLPPPGDSAGQGGQALASSVVVNGYLYVIGGCVNTACSDVSGNVSYAQISPDGTLAQPETCNDSYYGAWCVDSTNRVNGTTGAAAAGAAAFGNTIYIVGGSNGSSNNDTIYRNTVEDDGTLSGSWTTQSLSGTGADSVAHTFVHIRANPAAAATVPANLYIFGGCTTTSGPSCTSSNYSTAVYKCEVDTSGAVANCSTSGQLQIDSDPGSGGSQGLGLHSGAVYAGYIYLVGGYSQTQSDKDTVLYARFDDDNDVAAVSGGAWIESASTLATGQAAGRSFGHNGYLYSVGGFNAGDTTVIEGVEFAKINPGDGSLEAFSVSDTTVDTRWGLSAVVSSSRVYLLGGCASGAGTGSCSSLEPSVRTVEIHNNQSGAPASYNPSTNLFNTDRLAASSVVLDGYIYLAGGCIDSATCANVTDNVQYAPLDAHGNIGGWSNTTAALPNDRAWGQLEVAGGTIYYIGGQDDVPSASTDVYYAVPSSGDISSWSTASNGLPAARTMHSAAVWNDRIYVTGGNNASGTAQSTVYVSPDLSAGGNITSSWSSSTAFDVARSGHTTVAYAGNLYVIGGHSGTTYLSDVQFAKLNSDGTVGSWSFTSDLPLPIRQGDGFAANGYIYLFGGRSGDEEEDCQNRTFVAPISANTALSGSGDPTGLGQWYESSVYFGGKRFGIAAAHYQGKAYVLGGGCAALLDQFEIYSTPGAHTFTSPAETTQVVVEAWGGGGGGGSGENGGNNAAGAGAGGGGYARHTMSVTPGDYDLHVGAGGDGGIIVTEGNGVNDPGDDGEGSWFDTITTVFAGGGTGGGFGTSTGTGGSSNIGSDATFNGGGGGAGWASAQPGNRRGGGGGGSAFFNAIGGDGVDGTASTGSGTGGSGTGNGGDGANGTSAGGNGGTPGAGGGGGGYRGSGGDGADGRVLVFYQEWSELVLSGNDRVSIATLLSQPQTAKYTYFIDTDTDVFPGSWLVYGAQSPIGAIWQAVYMSSTSAGADWGQSTDFGDITPQQLETYTPLDGGGTDTEFARYYFFTLSIDDSSTYGYPGHADRSLTIEDISLYFTADPGKRLRHGGTFTGGERRPLDTPPEP